MATKRKKTNAKKTVSAQKAPPVAIRASSSVGIQDWRHRLPNFIIGVIAVFALVSLFFLAMQKSPAATVSQKGLFSFFATNKAGAEAESEATDETETQSTSYTVKEGDYLWSIAESAYGSGFNAYDIAQANNLQAPYILNPGQKLTLPQVKSMEPTVGEVPSQLEPTATSVPSNADVTTPKTYTTRDGDYLTKIAREVYNDETLWPIIYQANQAAIPYPDYVVVGQTLTIPPKP